MESTESVAGDGLEAGAGSGAVTGADTGITRDAWPACGGALTLNADGSVAPGASALGVAATTGGVLNADGATMLGVGAGIEIGVDAEAGAETAAEA